MSVKRQLLILAADNWSFEIICKFHHIEVWC